MNHIIYVIDDDATTPNRWPKVGIVSSMIFNLLFTQAKAYGAIGEFLTLLAGTPRAQKLKWLFAGNKALPRK